MLFHIIKTTNGLVKYPIITINSINPAHSWLFVTLTISILFLHLWFLLHGICSKRITRSAITRIRWYDTSGSLSPTSFIFRSSHLQIYFPIIYFWLFHNYLILKFSFCQHCPLKRNYHWFFEQNNH